VNKLYWDSCVFIYYLEADEKTRTRISEKMQSFPNASLCHTALTELECRVEPLRNGKHGLLRQLTTCFQARSPAGWSLTTRFIDAPLSCGPRIA
jgi:hypothetical protein